MTRMPCLPHKNLYLFIFLFWEYINTLVVVNLQAMENLKESVVMRKFQGRDPLSEYTADAFTLFKGLEDRMRVNAVYSLWQSFAVAPQPAVTAA